MAITDDVAALFGPCWDDDDQAMSASATDALLHTCWERQLSAPATRALAWRVLLGVLSPADKPRWAAQLGEVTARYAALKTRLMPRIESVKADPLSALLFTSSPGKDKTHTTSNAGNAAEPCEWSEFYKHVELTDFIKGDLDRLYLQGIEDEFFQTQRRRDVVLTVLFLWAALHKTISYRQGMHEIVGCILFVVEQESVAWQQWLVLQEKERESEGNDALQKRQQRAFAECFVEKNIEAFTFSLFERVMLELACLYDPAQVYDGQPFVVQYCSKLQEHYLRILDPVLSQHLEECFVPSQLYGLRWSRLLLGREFAITHTHTLRLWDYMFACCFDAESRISGGTGGESALSLTHSSLLAVSVHTQSSESEPCVDKEKREKERERQREILKLRERERARNDSHPLSAPSHNTHKSIYAGLPNVYSLSAHAIMCGYDKTSNALQSERGGKLQYVCTPLLGACGDVMLAMLLQIRDALLASDSNTIITHVMRYPQRESVSKLIECADKIRRGVLVRDINANGSVLNDSPFESHQSAYSPSPTPTPGVGVGGGGEGARFPLVVGVKDKLLSFKSAMGSGLSEIVQSIAAPLLDNNNNNNSSSALNALSQDDDAAHKLTGYEDLFGGHANPEIPCTIAGNGGETGKVSGVGVAGLATPPPRNPLAVTRRRAAPAPTPLALSLSQSPDPLLCMSVTVCDSPPAVPPEGEGERQRETRRETERETEREMERDPLTGLPLSDPLSGKTQSPVKRAPQSAVSQAKPRSGTGTGYGNLPDSLSLSLDPLGASTPSQSTHNGAHSAGSQAGAALSLFSPSWFPSSAAKQSKSRQRESDKQRNRQSSGVDLRALSLSLSQGGVEQDGVREGVKEGVVREGVLRDGAKEGVKENSAALRAKELAVRDRLLDIADHLLQISSHAHNAYSQQAIIPTQPSDPLSNPLSNTLSYPLSNPPSYPVPNPLSNPLSPVSPPGAEEDVCVSVARRLAALASVLAGDASVVDFDLRFANRALSTTLPPSQHIQYSQHSHNTERPRTNSLSHTQGPHTANVAVLTESAVRSLVEQDDAVGEMEMDDELKSVSSEAETTPLTDDA